MTVTDHNAFWEFPPDPRDNGMEYPNFNIIGSLSGHNITLDDSKGAESLTINHGSGSSIQFHPDGSVAIKTHGKKYEMILGDSHIIITGKSDITVNGPSTMKVEGDYTLNVTGNMRTIVEGNMETLVAGKKSEHIEGDVISTVSGNKTTYVSGSILQASTDRTYMVAKAGMKLQTTGGHMYFQSAASMKSYSSSGMNFQSGSSMNVKSGAKYILSAKGLTTFKGGSQMGMDASQIFMNSGLSQDAENA